MKHTRKLFTLLALLVCLFALLAVTAHAEELTFSGGPGIVCTLDTETGVFTVSGSGDMKDYGYDGVPWRGYRGSITSAVIEPGITSIGSHVFQDCGNMTAISIPEGVTRIGTCAFGWCGSMKEVVFPSTLEVIEGAAFRQCVSARFSDLPEGLTTIGESAFWDCDRLSKVEIPDSVTFLGSEAFRTCEDLAEVIMSDSLTSVSNTLFYECRNLVSVTLPSGTTAIGDNAFRGCTSLVHIEFPSTLKSIGYWTFAGCTSLKGIVLNEGLQTISEAAFWETGVEHIILPSTLTYIGSDAFRVCGNLKKVAALSTDCEYYQYSSSILGEVGTSIIYCYPGSTTEAIAANHGYAYLYISDSNLWTDEVEPAPHIHDVVALKSKAATCTTDGLGEGLVCSECQVILQEQEVIPSPGHSYGQWQVVVEATASTEGKQERTCATCGNVETQVIPVNNPFTDVFPTDYYYTPVLWAVDENITAGATPTEFAPGQDCTRAQVVTFLYRVNGEPEVSGTNPFTDVTKDDYYYNAVLWAVNKGITAGTSPTTFSPDQPCTRCQVATFLWRYVGTPAPSSSSNPFVDVSSREYYYVPVLWAAENNITKGDGAENTFNPNGVCIRAQIVTFLHRALAAK